jgi:hypothetical protein
VSPSELFARHLICELKKEFHKIADPSPAQQRYYAQQLLNIIAGRYPETLPEQDWRQCPIPEQQNLIGRTFGSWLVLRFHHVDKTKGSRHRFWLAICQCHELGLVRADALLRGETLCCKGCSGLRRYGKTGVA